MPRVLLVDDDIAEISAVKRVLARAGHQPVLATNGADALAALSQSPPALLLVGATCENGDAVRACAAADGARGIPILVLGQSDSAPAGTTQVPRPIDPDQLVAEVSAAIAAAAALAAASAGRSAPVRANGSPADPSRRAAADALKARAEELRRGSRPAEPPAAELSPACPSPAPAPAADGPAPAGSDPTVALTVADDDADAALAALEDPLPVGAVLDLEHDPGLEAILRRAEEAERAHAAERKASARQADRAAAEAHQRAEAEKVAVERTARARAEEEARRRAEEEARRAEEARREATERERREREAREDLEGELERLRQAADEGAKQRDDEEEELRSAIASARAEMEALRRRSEDEARRRVEAEAEIARLARDAERKLAEEAAQPPPFDFPEYRPPRGDPAPDPAQELARRRVAALRGERTGPEELRERDDEPRPRPTRSPPPELRAGLLADLPAPRLLALAARAEVTGRIDFEGEAARSLYLEDGRIVGATSSDPAERVEELALRLGLVTRDQHRLAGAAAAPLATRRAAVFLLERGFLKPTELTGLVRRRTEEVAFGVFGDAGAAFQWSAAEVPPDERTALERTTLQLAVEGVRRRWLEPHCRAVLGGDGTLLAPVATGPSPADLALSPDERRVLALADGLRTLDEVVAASPLDPLSTLQALAALVLVSALAVRTFQGGRPAAAATAAIDLARVRDKLDQVRRADYFTILGVGRLCTPHEVREAFERLRSEFDPRRFHGVREDGLEARLEEIQRVVADARDVLADDRLREEYLRGLAE